MGRLSFLAQDEVGLLDMAALKAEEDTEPAPPAPETAAAGAPQPPPAALHQPMHPQPKAPALQARPAAHDCCFEQPPPGVQQQHQQQQQAGPGRQPDAPGTLQEPVLQLLLGSEEEEEDPGQQQEPECAGSALQQQQQQQPQHQHQHQQQQQEAGGDEGSPQRYCAPHTASAAAAAAPTPTPTPTPATPAVAAAAAATAGHGRGFSRSSRLQPFAHQPSRPRRAAAAVAKTRTQQQLQYERSTGTLHDNTVPGDDAAAAAAAQAGAGPAASVVPTPSPAAAGRQAGSAQQQQQLLLRRLQEKGPLLPHKALMSKWGEQLDLGLQQKRALLALQIRHELDSSGSEPGQYEDWDVNKPGPLDKMLSQPCMVGQALTYSSSRHRSQPIEGPCSKGKVVEGCLIRCTGKGCRGSATCAFEGKRSRWELHLQSKQKRPSQHIWLDSIDANLKALAVLCTNVDLSTTHCAYCRTDCDERAAGGRGEEGAAAGSAAAAPPASAVAATDNAAPPAAAAAAPGPACDDAPKEQRPGGSAGAPAAAAPQEAGEAEEEGAAAAAGPGTTGTGADWYHQLFETGALSKAKDTLMCCSSCPATFHRGCYVVNMGEEVGAAEDWQCASCRAGATCAAEGCNWCATHKPQDHGCDMEQLWQEVQQGFEAKIRDQDQDQAGHHQPGSLPAAAATGSAAAPPSAAAAAGGGGGGAAAGAARTQQVGASGQRHQQQQRLERRRGREVQQQQQQQVSQHDEPPGQQARQKRQRLPARRRGGSPPAPRREADQQTAAPAAAASGSDTTSQGHGLQAGLATATSSGAAGTAAAQRRQRGHGAACAGSTGDRPSKRRRLEWGEPGSGLPEGQTQAQAQEPGPEAEHKHEPEPEQDTAAGKQQQLPRGAFQEAAPPCTPMQQQHHHHQEGQHQEQQQQPPRLRLQLLTAEDWRAAQRAAQLPPSAQDNSSNFLLLAKAGLLKILVRAGASVPLLQQADAGIRVLEGQQRRQQQAGPEREAVAVFKARYELLLMWGEHGVAAERDEALQQLLEGLGVNVSAAPA